MIEDEKNPEDEWKCSSCGASVAEDATVCPKCGEDISEIEKEKIRIDKGDIVQTETSIYNFCMESSNSFSNINIRIF
jgi:uncharacterized membrane protein YvbJ